MTPPPDDLPSYRVITGKDDAAFCHRVAEAIEFGYRLHGAPALTFNGIEVIVGQAMVWPAITQPLQVREVKMLGAKLRVARATDDIDALIPFYRSGLGFEILFRFKGHEGFDGVMLGHSGAPYHFEFTKPSGHVVGRAPTQDNLLVFYMPDPVAWQDAIGRMEAAGFSAVPAFNSYWDQSGRTFEDADGYRVVLQRASWDL